MPRKTLSGPTALKTVIGRLEKYGKKAEAGLSIEAVHQLRVHSRRLNASLGVFRDLFPGPELKQWRRRIRALLKGLGSLRDRDVKIDFLKKARKALRERQAQEMIRGSIGSLEKEKAVLEAKALRGVKAFRRSRTLEGIKASLGRGKKENVARAQRKLQKRARKMVFKSLRDISGLKEYVDRPSRAGKLHQLRLAIKNLRYCLESLEPVTGGELKDHIAYCRRLQAHLGDMHDHELWRADQELRPLYPVIARMRSKSYRSFRQAWRAGEKRRFWKKLKEDFR